MCKSNISPTSTRFNIAHRRANDLEADLYQVLLCSLDDVLVHHREEVMDLMRDASTMIRRIDRLHHDYVANRQAAEAEAADREIGSF